MTDLIHRDAATPTLRNRTVTRITDAEVYVASTCFKTGPPALLGIELEWILHDRHDPAAAIGAERLTAALGPHAPVSISPHSPAQPLPAGSSVTVEPGGQIEISTQPYEGLTECIAATTADATYLLSLLRNAALAPAAAAADEHRLPQRILRSPRYAAMNRHFDSFGPDGVGGMCSTAAVQVCVDTGLTTKERWWLLHLIGPPLIAAFANSPRFAGQDTGWKSTRRKLWAASDPHRVGLPDPDLDPATGYARYALNAQVIAIRRDGADWTPPGRFTFAEWIDGRHGPAPTYEDLEYHLSTLFPPVRPRGSHLEIRYLDAQPGDGWVVPLAVLSALLDDPIAADIAAGAAESLAQAGSQAWSEAARYGLADPAMRTAAIAILDASIGALRRTNADAAIVERVEDFFQTYTVKGRSPADDGTLSPEVFDDANRRH
jgi:glutamate--cysteine ligase